MKVAGNSHAGGLGWDKEDSIDFDKVLTLLSSSVLFEERESIFLDSVAKASFICNFYRSPRTSFISAGDLISLLLAISWFRWVKQPLY